MVLVMYDLQYGSVMVKVSAKYIHIYGKHVIAMISDCEHNRNVLLCQEGSMDPTIAGQDPLLTSSQIDITGLGADWGGLDGIDDIPQHLKDVSNVFEPNDLS